MNFLELINKCLLELNYRPVNSFSELVKNDHKKIITNLNVVNKEICAIEGWNFLIRHQRITIPANVKSIQNPINGRILYFLVEGKVYTYVSDFGLFLKGKAPEKSYSVCDDKILLPKFKDAKSAEIFYYTKNSVISANGTEKMELTDEEDESLIPMPFAQQLLVYGACLRLKANPSYIRFSYWLSMYKEALLNLKSKSSVYAKDAPSVRLFRN